MSRGRIESLAKLPPNCVRPLGVLAPATLRQWAQAAGHRYVEVDLAATTDKKSVLTAIGQALGFPRYFGANLDALYDSLTELADGRAQPGYVVTLLELPHGDQFDAEQRDALLDVFRDAAEVLADQGVALRVFYQRGAR